ncbi:hypothetical protein SB780_36665, partial [Burkholderia sp. SIMBA_057]
PLPLSLPSLLKFLFRLPIVIVPTHNPSLIHSTFLYNPLLQWESESVHPVTTVNARLPEI